MTVTCALPGQEGSRLANRVASFRYVETSHVKLK